MKKIKKILRILSYVVLIYGFLWFATFFLALLAFAHGWSADYTLPYYYVSGIFLES